jgi:dihydropteroate synthase
VLHDGLMTTTSRPTLRCGDRALPLGTRTFVMGIVNVTPDSFSDGGRFVDVDAAVAHAEALFLAGADIVDIGGESTRPGAAPVDVDTERARVVPVIEALVARGHTAISIDTRHATVAAAALSAGAAWVNDVTAFGDDDMARVCRAAQGVVLMHWANSAAGSGVANDVADDDIAANVSAWLGQRVARAIAAGVDPAVVVVDPGIGFGKTVAHNVILSRDLDTLRRDSGGAAVLYGPSRKRFLGTLTGQADPAARDHATIGAVCAAIAAGADIVRVHAVAEARDAVLVADAILRR